MDSVMLDLLLCADSCVYLKLVTVATRVRTRFTLSANRTSGVWVVVAFIANLVQLAVLQRAQIREEDDRLGA